MFQNTPLTHTLQFHDQIITLQTGLLAHQATGSVLASCGETTVLAAVVVGKVIEADYFPLQVIYEERMYASGKIKGSRFQKREGRPSETAVLTGRMVDRSLRSLFDQNLRQEIQVVITVLSIDEINSPDTLAVLAASCALKLAGIKEFGGPVSSVRIGLLPWNLGADLLAKSEPFIEQAESFQDLRQNLQEVCQTLNENEPQDNEYLTQIFSHVGRKNPEWAAKLRLMYKTTTRLSSEEIQKQYDLQPNLVSQPSYEIQAKSKLDLVVSGGGTDIGNIVMVEAGAHIVSESIIGIGLDKAVEEIQILNAFQNEFLDKANDLHFIKETTLEKVEIQPNLLAYWEQYSTNIETALYHDETNKSQKNAALKAFQDEHFNLLEALISLSHNPEINSIQNILDTVQASDIESTHLPVEPILSLVSEPKELSSLKKKLELALKTTLSTIVKRNILQYGKRLDGRPLDQTRLITCQINVLPHTHGSSLFQRGETQVLNVLTLGTARDAQTLDDMEDFEETTKRYIHHYNFPAYSVGETGRYFGPGRREIGHGALAEKALLPVLPSEDEFPYTMRLVSECLGSNGSTSMASTCSSCLSLLAGGVPIKDLVAGVAMGLVLDQKTNQFKVITDILGAEDHFGDMDFKVTGTKNGITAIQLDNKVAGLTAEILKQALAQSLNARLHILGIMSQTISAPNPELSRHAPRVKTLTIPFEKIGDVIGPSGKIIKSIIQRFDVAIDIEDNTGKTFIYGKDASKIEAALQFIQALIKEYQSGDVVSGDVFRIEAYGAFVKIDGTDKEGLIHISQLTNHRVNKVEDILKLGQTIQAKVVEVNDRGQISLSMKEFDQSKAS